MERQDSYCWICISDIETREKVKVLADAGLPPFVSCLMSGLMAPPLPLLPTRPPPLLKTTPTTTRSEAGASRFDLHKPAS